MPKQYTFRTTRRTAWVEEVLDQFESGDRAAIIRELIIAGIEVKGLKCDEDTQRKHNILQGKTIISQGDTPVKITTFDKSVYAEERFSIPTPPPPPTEPIEDIEEEDLESKLDNLGY